MIAIIIGRTKPHVAVSVAILFILILKYVHNMQIKESFVSNTDKVYYNNCINYLNDKQDGKKEISIISKRKTSKSLKTLSNNVARIESSVSTISGILIFFTIIWAISLAVFIYNLN